MVSYHLAVPNPESSEPPPAWPGGGSVEDLYGHFRRPAFALARRILTVDALAEDVLQEVFLAVWRNPGAYEPARGTFSAWLMSMVHHKAVDAVRREESHHRRQLRAEGELAVDASDVAPDVADEACDRAAHANVRTALSALPAVQREALTLAYYGGYTQREIATLTASPLGTVKGRMHAGMRQLRRDLRTLAPLPIGSATSH